MPKKNADSEKTKDSRLEAIMHLISEEPIGTQQELADRLCRLGFDVTQATVSRDIKELKLIKTAVAEGGYRYRLSRSEEKFQATKKFYSLYSTAAVSADFALNQVVVKCYTGMAGAVCAAMDGMDWDGVLGTIAGDDTILIITKSEGHARTLLRKLREIK